MFMRKAVIAVLFLSLACASHRGANAPVTMPEVTLVQTGGVASAARNIAGPIPVRYAIRVVNKASEPITLMRIDMQSIGTGAYTLTSTSRPFKTAITPESYQDVEIATTAIVENPTILGANGPVTIRVILQFDSPLGKFQDVVVQQVNDKLTGEIPQ